MEIRTNTPIVKCANNAYFGFSFSQDENSNKELNNKIIGKIFKNITPKINKGEKYEKDLSKAFDLCGFLKNEYNNFLLKNIVIQINVPSKFSKMMTKVGSFIESKFESLGKKIQCAYSGDIAIALYNQERGLVLLGLDILNNHAITNNLAKHMNRDDVLSFVIFHEFSHCIEVKNDLLINYDEKHIGFKSLIENIHKYLMEYGDGFNKMLSKQGATIQFNMSEAKEIKHLHSIYRECYADVSAILLYKNFLIEKKEYSPEKFLNFIQAVDESRQTNFFNKLPQKDIGYATFLAIGKLFDKKLLPNINLFNNDKLTTDLIHEIASVTALQSFAEISTLKMEDDDIIKNLFKKLSCFELNNGTEYLIKEEPNLKKIEKIKTLGSDFFMKNKEAYKKTFI